MTRYPLSITPKGHAAPVPRRVRARQGGRWVVDTTSAVYVWEVENYPQFYLPVADVDPGLLADPALKPRLRRHPDLPDHVRIRWDALDHWFEEEEEVFVLDLTHLEPSPTETACPCKGRTTAYWSARIGDRLHEDLAWSYAFPTRQLLPIAGLVAFYDELVDVFLDGLLQERPVRPRGRAAPRSHAR